VPDVEHDPHFVVIRWTRTTLGRTPKRCAHLPNLGFELFNLRTGGLAHRRIVATIKSTNAVRASRSSVTKGPQFAVVSSGLTRAFAQSNFSTSFPRSRGATLAALGAFAGIMVERFFSNVRPRDWRQRKPITVAPTPRQALDPSPSLRATSGKPLHPKAPDAADQLRIVMGASFSVQPLLNKSEARVFRELDRNVMACNPTWQARSFVATMRPRTSFLGSCARGLGDKIRIGQSSPSGSKAMWVLPWRSRETAARMTRLPKTLPLRFARERRGPPLSLHYKVHPIGRPLRTGSTT
jgi:hypothetical protein